MKLLLTINFVLSLVIKCVTIALKHSYLFVGNDLEVFRLAKRQEHGKRVKHYISAKRSLLKQTKILWNRSHRGFLVFFLIDFPAFVWFFCLPHLKWLALSLTKFFMCPI